MSSLAAARADNFYFPTDFDPKKHGSLNKYHGQHALRDRASKLKSEGILVIRFEVPFHIWCDKCGEKIAKGERFNADKKGIGFYHSTRIWQFSMRHHCGCIITIQTDPKRAEYIVVEGARKKVEGVQSAADAEVIELADDAEKERLAKDPLYRLEQGEASRKRARSEAERVADLKDEADAKHQDPYAVNRSLRAQLRVIRKADEALDKERKALHLPEEVRLLPAAEDDAVAATLAFYAHDSAHGAAAQQADKRRAIMSQSIFSKSAATAAASGKAAPSLIAAPLPDRSSSHVKSGVAASGGPAAVTGPTPNSSGGGEQRTAGPASSSGLAAADGQRQAGLGSSVGATASARLHGGSHGGGASHGKGAGHTRCQLGAGPGQQGMPMPKSYAQLVAGSRTGGGAGSGGQQAKTIKEKAALLAKRRQLQGVGLKLPVQGPASRAQLLGHQLTR